MKRHTSRKHTKHGTIEQQTARRRARRVARRLTVLEARRVERAAAVARMLARLDAELGKEKPARPKTADEHRKRVAARGILARRNRKAGVTPLLSPTLKAA